MVANTVNVPGLKGFAPYDGAHPVQCELVTCTMGTPGAFVKGDLVITASGKVVKAGADGVPYGIAAQDSPDADQPVKIWVLKVGALVTCSIATGTDPGFLEPVTAMIGDKCSTVIVSSTFALDTTSGTNNCFIVKDILQSGSTTVPVSKRMRGQEKINSANAAYGGRVVAEFTAETTAGVRLTNS